MQASMHPYSPIIASALRRPQLWRLGLLLLGGLLIGTVMTPLFFVLVGWAAPNLSPFQVGPRGIMIGATPGGMFTILASFSLLIFGTAHMAKRLHGRGLRDLTGPAPLMRAQFVVTLKWVAGFTVLLFFLPWDGGTDPIENLSTGMWLFWLPFALLGLMIQVTAEELFFRGYLQSQVAGVTGSYPLAVAASSVLFGLAHMNGTADGIAAVFPVVWAMGFGALAGDLTMRSGTIGPGIALHFINNLAPIVLSPQQDTMSGFGLLVRTDDPAVIMADPKVMIFQTLLLFATWLVARIAIRR